MKRLISLLILAQITLFGYEYDTFLLKVQSSIFPKLALLDKDISKKIANGQLVFYIVYHEGDGQKAVQIKKMLKQKYGDNLDKYKFKVVLKEFSEISLDDADADVYYILQGSHSMVQKVCNIAQNNNILTFVYDPIYFKDGALISMTIEKSSIIYLNKSMHKQYGINFVDIFYQTIRFYDE